MAPEQGIMNEIDSGRLSLKEFIVFQSEAAYVFHYGKMMKLPIKISGLSSCRKQLFFYAEPWGDP